MLSQLQNCTLFIMIVRLECRSFPNLPPILTKIALLLIFMLEQEPKESEDLTVLQLARRLKFTVLKVELKTFIGMIM